MKDYDSVFLGGAQQDDDTPPPSAAASTSVSYFDSNGT
eukprot:CAMPEP_0113518674 /NCGR_PEP_ID=MMETSP0014_2-20120614/43081_1 /TAXON_ID=2857 /ORGANISM="Nitzschia sp." /LENGTH=37 /DNA_ID=CAMNT_0000416279 /DNA_START=61 /DNA_END=171 /DNA_ORIENTATION=- /assembly_acc=CAM_ASM_000159